MKIDFQKKSLRNYRKSQKHESHEGVLLKKIQFLESFNEIRIF